MTPFEWVVGDSSKNHTVTAPTTNTRASHRRLHHTTGHYRQGLHFSADDWGRTQEIRWRIQSSPHNYVLDQPTHEPRQPRHTHQRHNDLMDAPTARLKPRPTVVEKARNASITRKTITNYAQTATQEIVPQLSQNNRSERQV